MAPLAARQVETEPGSHRDKPDSSSLSAFVSTLIPNLIIALLFLIAFLISRKRFRRVYAPRTYIQSPRTRQKTPVPSFSFLGWISDFCKLEDKYILEHNSLDGYLFIRYLKLIIVVSLLGCSITWPILFPVNATGGNGLPHLDKLAFGNVREPYRYFAHALVSWVYLGALIYSSRIHPLK